VNKAITSVLIIISLFFMATCGPESDHGSDTGAIGLSLKWDSTSSYSLYSVLSTNNDVCLEYGIEKISAEVYNSSGTKVAFASWVCSARSGTISDVPSGTDMQVIIEGSMSGSVLWSGEASNVSVSVGQTRDVPVTMSYIGSDTTVPSINVMNPLPGTIAVAINTSISVTFNKQMVWTSGDNTQTFFTVNNGSVDILGSVTYDPYTYTLTFTPDSDLSYATTYTVTISSDVEDIGGNKMTGPYTWIFTTRPGLPDTGQTANYTDTFGEDSDYNINPPSYVDNADGTVTDNNTGLMWQQTDDGVTYDWYKASGTTDTVLNPGGIDVCGNLITAGYGDWRLPSVRELLTIFNFEAPSPAIDLRYFPDTKTAAYYLPSNTSAANPDNTFSIYFDQGGYSYIESKASGGYVRCVRGSQLLAPNFTDNRDGTVTDNSTGLMWQQREGGFMNWDFALNYCEDSNEAGYLDWRLPNIKELESIVDVTKSTDPAIDTAFFPSANSGYYWSSTTYFEITTYASNIGFTVSGSPLWADLKSDSQYVRCVRNNL